MMYPPVFLIHTITLIHREESGQTASGEPVYTTTVTTDIPCRLSGAAARSVSGTVYSARCSLYPGHAIAEDDIVIPDNEGYARKYWVNSVQTVYEPTQANVSHIILELRDTEYRREL